MAMTFKEYMNKTGITEPGVRKRGAAALGRTISLREEVPDEFWNHYPKPELSEATKSEILPAPAPKPETKPAAKPKPQSVLMVSDNSKAGLDLYSKTAFGICTGIQILHSAGFAYLVSPHNNELLRYASSIGLACAVDVTSVVMTYNGATRWYLYGFGLYHFVVNSLFHYLHHNSVTIYSLVLSAGLAFSQYSYSELFVNKTK